MGDILGSIRWVRDTIKDRLMFGMEDSPLQAAYSRERRASGVLLECEQQIRKLKKSRDFSRKASEELLKENKELKSQHLTFIYTNHNNIKSKRTVLLSSVKIGLAESKYYDSNEVVLSAYCMDREAFRDFALKKIECDTSK